MSERSTGRMWPTHEFIGGYEIDPTQPAICQICGQKHQARDTPKGPREIPMCPDGAARALAGNLRWPTPRVSDGKGGKRILDDQGRRTNKAGTILYGANLADAVTHEPVAPASPQLTLFAEAFPASPTPWLVDVADLKMNATCGRTSSASSPSSDLDTSCSRTSPASSPRPMPDMTDAAYAAGLVDGEGCLMLSKDLGPVLFVGMTIKARAVLDQMAARWGGKVDLKRKATAKWEAACMWRMSATVTLRPFLETILPFLKLKAPQVELLLRVFDLKAECPHRSDGRAVFSDEMRARLETIRLTIQHLNRKGPTTEMPATAIAQLVAGQWVTNQRDFLSETGLAPYCETWPRSGCMSSGIIYPQVPSAPLTGETESGSWPTQTEDGNYNRKGASATSGDGLATAVRQRATAIKAWPTPAASDWKGEYKPATVNARALASSRGVRLPEELAKREQNSGSLNPTWVEWLMGYPTEWTALEASAIPSSRKSRNGLRTGSRTRKRGLTPGGMCKTEHGVTGLSRFPTSGRFHVGGG